MADIDREDLVVEQVEQAESHEADEKGDIAEQTENRDENRDDEPNIEQSGEEPVGGGYAHLAAEGLFLKLGGLSRPTRDMEVAAETACEVCSEDIADESSSDRPDDADTSEGRIPKTLAVFPVRHTVVFPYMLTPVQASREKSVKVIESVSGETTLIAIASQKDSDIDDPTGDDLYPVATAARVVKTLKLPDGSINVLVQGLHRVRLIDFIQAQPYLVASIELIPEHIERSIELEGLIRNAQGLFQKIVNLTPYLPDELAVAALNIDEPEKLTDFIASSINLSVEEKASLLASGDVLERFKAITVYLNREFEIVETGAKIQSQVRSEVDKSQKEFYLRRQLELIQQELGQGDEQSREIAEFKQRIDAAGMTEEAHEEALRELDRLERMHPSAAEYTVSRSYLDWLVSLPWATRTQDNLSISAAHQVLERDHFGLAKIKDRILEYLAVRKLKADMKGPIICFVGPPGVGKTSLGQSIAKALGRKFVRISLGGIHDEAEIRGHRRTYIGALPGKVIQGIRKAGTSNPVFMLDEIDKVGADYRGDPSSALLEVLDPQQNDSFQDHYLGVSFDLSQVMFITTANILDPIPPALKDRMEVLELPGYTEDEKLNIAKGFLIPRQLEAHGLSSESIKFDDSALFALIRGYTREAGVRNLEREVANICRKVAKDRAVSMEAESESAPEESDEALKPGGKSKTRAKAKTKASAKTTVDESQSEKSSEVPITVTPVDVEKFLGIPRYRYGLAGEADEVGVVTGLSWTPVGGEILFVEASLVEGRGRLTLTGRLGETMQESAKAAMTYARMKAHTFGYPSSFNKMVDIHIHVPEGAIPKDGPSAGVTMVTALISTLTGRPVRKDVAMTGEITLRGKVLPIGGVKEKVLAAHRAGIKLLLLPKDNEKDIAEIPAHVKKDLNLIMVERVDEVVMTAIDWSTEVAMPRELLPEDTEGGVVIETAKSNRVVKASKAARANKAGKVDNPDSIG